MPPTLKKLKEDRLSITSKILKKDQDFLPISPELIKDLRDRTLFSTTSMRLSFAQYDKMCNDDEVLTMMSVALDKPKDKLKKFCKYLSVFKQNIYLSPNKITAKITEADTQDKPIFKLPKEVRTAILDKFAEILPSKYVLLDWIDKKKLNWSYLSQNPSAIDLLKENTHKIDWSLLSGNPNPDVIKLLEERIKYENNLDDNEYIELVTSGNNICWYSLSQNPNAIKLLKKNYNEIVWYKLAKNSNPNVIKLLQKQIKVGFTDNDSEESVWFSLSQNPNTMEILKDNPDKIIWCELSKNSNPDAIELLKNRITYESNLSREEYYDLEGRNRINWKGLSANPNAIDLLKENPEQINFNYLSANPKAIDLLKEQIKYENTLDVEEYKALENKINWEKLSANPNAIDLLKERIEYEKYNHSSDSRDSSDSAKHNYINRINWKELSGNPNAINLIKERIKYENNLSREEYYDLKIRNKINWRQLSSNPSIFTPLY
jgi:hypothetical protein